MFVFCAKIRFSAMAGIVVFFPVEMEYCASKQSICVLHSKVFVWPIQKYLCNSFKTAFHQAWQGEGCKNIANSAKTMRHKLIRPSNA